MAPYKFTRIINEGGELSRYGDGSTKRDYTYIKDIIEGILAALRNEFRFEIINLGNSRPVELGYFISLIEYNLRKKAKIKVMPSQPGESDLTYGSIKKAKKLLNWEPKTNVEEGMKNFIEWYKNERA